MDAQDSAQVSAATVQCACVKTIVKFMEKEGVEHRISIQQEGKRGGGVALLHTN